MGSPSFWALDILLFVIRIGKDAETIGKTLLSANPTWRNKK
jgi:hypothetical protein